MLGVANYRRGLRALAQFDHLGQKGTRLFEIVWMAGMRVIGIRLTRNGQVVQCTPGVGLAVARTLLQHPPTGCMCVFLPTLYYFFMGDRGR